MKALGSNTAHPPGIAPDDTLALVLEMLRVRGAVMGAFRAHAPWGLRLPRAQGATFHAVTRGACWVRVPDRAPRELRPGDVVLLPTGAGHVVASDATGPARAWDSVAKAQARTTTGEIVLPGSGNATHVICAAYDYDREVVHPLLSLLPPVLFVHGDGGPERDAVRHALQLLHRELTSPSAGSAIIIDRLIDVRFVHVLHAWVDGQNDHGRSRLLGLRNPSIARALDDAVSTIAHRVGYTSEFAFSRALSRLRGRPPGRYRAEARGRRDQSGPELRAVVGSR